MTQEAKIARRLFSEYQDGLTWAQVVSAVQSATAQDKAAIVDSLKSANQKNFFLVFQRLVGTHLKGLALADATAMLADDSISRAELDRFL